MPEEGWPGAGNEKDTGVESPGQLAKSGLGLSGNGAESEPPAAACGAGEMTQPGRPQTADAPGAVEPPNFGPPAESEMPTFGSPDGEEQEQGSWGYE